MSTITLKNSLPHNIEIELQSILDVLKRHGVQRVILYGSFARGDDRDESDFDLCVDGIFSRDFFLGGRGISHGNKPSTEHCRFERCHRIFT